MEYNDRLLALADLEDAIESPVELSLAPSGDLFLKPSQCELSRTGT